MELYSNIKKRREELGITQDELAKLTGYTSRTSIAKIEAGKVDLPQSKIEAFAKALKTTPGYLMGWNEEEKNQKETAQDDIITTYNLTPDELLEYEKIKNINRALFFNDNRGSEEDKEELDDVLKKIFVKSLLNKRNKEKIIG